MVDQIAGACRPCQQTVMRGCANEAMVRLEEENPRRRCVV